MTKETKPTKVKGIYLKLTDVDEHRLIDHEDAIVAKWEQDAAGLPVTRPKRADVLLSLIRHALGNSESERKGEGQ